VTTLKRRAEADLWRQELEIKTTRLQATLLEQRSMLIWGPAVLEVFFSAQ